jgi:hypothetical protein
LSTPFHIDLDWLPPFQGSEEIRRTSAAIRIAVGAENATRYEDEFSQSVQQAVRASAYPLALWLASSWWRIRWEPLPSRIRLSDAELPADVSWRMSHELAAAGHGFVWPRLIFASDGDTISVQCRASSPLSEEPVRYLSEFDAWVKADEFESAVDRFVELVVRRLDNLGETDLHVLWQELLAERADPQQSAGRRIEARLGYDPDEAPPELIERCVHLAAQAGEGAVDEIAPVCAGREPDHTLDEVIRLASRPGISGKISLGTKSFDRDRNLAPWQTARRLARELRSDLGLGTGGIGNETLAELIGVHAQDLSVPTTPSTLGPIGLAVRNGSGNELKFLFRRRNEAGRRFEAARFIADFLSPEQHDRWLPLTDAATARQKLQRAFAAEFLCPIESLKSFLGAEFLPEAFEEAAEHFGISERTVTSHLANHHLIPRDFVEHT